jgi:hypothetical protein
VTQYANLGSRLFRKMNEKHKRPNDGMPTNIQKEFIATLPSFLQTLALPFNIDTSLSEIGELARQPAVVVNPQSPDSCPALTMWSPTPTAQSRAFVYDPISPTHSGDFYFFPLNMYLNRM